jgi:regulator of protease activity HflC (stomatin/prohibitin superfamily)
MSSQGMKLALAGGSGFTPVRIGILIGIIVTFFVVLHGFWGSFGTIQSGDTGVVTQWGAVQYGDLKTEGLYMVTPFVQKVHEMNTRPNKVEFNGLAVCRVRWLREPRVAP